MSRLFLIDASITETNAVRLKFTDAAGNLRELIDDKYKPYFASLHPLSNEDKQVVDHFSGETQLIEKTDLFTNEKKMLTKISWPNAIIMSKASERFGTAWETEIDPVHSYIYDKRMNFGALHSEEDLKPIQDVSSEVTERFRETFGELQKHEPLKYAEILRLFNLISQPIPSLNPSLIGAGDADADRLSCAWTLSRIANLPLSQTVGSSRVSDWLKSMMYYHLRKSGILVPTAQELTRGKTPHTVTGALTVTPKSGMYFGTIVCDFESLYPSCIDSFNLSYETVDCTHPQCASNKVADFDGHICVQRRGFYSILIGALKELRIRIFKPAVHDSAMAEEQRRIAAATAKLLKLILVSSYGVTVRIRGLACPPLAEAITGFGRYVLKESWKMAEERSMNPLYGDTDSLFLDHPSDEQVEWLIKEVKSRFRLDLAVEKCYSLCVLPNAKKAYFGILSDGTLDLKGVTAAKSNSPPFVTKIFKRSVQMLVDVKNQEEFMAVQSRIKEVVRNGMADLKARRIPLSDLAYSVKLYFDPNEKVEDSATRHQPYQCAAQLMDAGKKLKRGEIVSFVKVKPFKYKGKNFTVKPVESVISLGEINNDDYVRNLLTALNQVFEPMGIELQTDKTPQISRWLENQET